MKERATMTATASRKDDDDRSPVWDFVTNRTVLAGLLVICMLGFLVYQLRAASKKAEDRQQLEKVKEMVAEATPKGNVLDVVKMMARRDESEMREKQKAIREEAKKLSPESQRELMQGQIKMMTNLTRQVLQMPKAQQNAVVDLFIDTMEAGRKRMEQQRAAQAASGNSEGENARLRRPRTDEDRDRARRAFFDNMAPEDRATMVEGIRLMNDRRRERGLPPMAPIGRPPSGGPSR
jgi:hypothetical protein